jgi:DNA topoisomerase-1
MKLLTLLSQFGESVHSRIATVLVEGLKAKFDPDKHPRDRRGRWSDGGATRGIAYDSESGAWVDTNGKPVAKKIVDRIEKLKIPKNLIGVKLNPDESHPRQAMGYFFDKSKGMVGSKRYFYSDDHNSEAYAKKFTALKKFDKVKSMLASAAYKDALDGNKAAGVVFLMDQTAIRVGSGRGGGREESGIGCCDLRVRHVKVTGNNVTLKFTGKSGVPFNHTYKSAKLATVINSFLNEGTEQKGRNDLLFGTTDDTVRNYLRKTIGTADAKELKPHHYRYWHGTRIATEIVQSMVKSNMKAKDVLRIKKEACEKVAAFLNNTPAVAFQQYIDPSVWQFMPEGVNFTLPKNSKSATAYSNLDMEELFDSTVYPEFGWEDEVGIDSLFDGIDGEAYIDETADDRKAYAAFLADTEGYPED